MKIEIELRTLQNIVKHIQDGDNKESIALIKEAIADSLLGSMQSTINNEPEAANLKQEEIVYLVEVELPNKERELFYMKDEENEEPFVGDSVIVPYRDGIYIGEVLTVNRVDRGEAYLSNIAYARYLSGRNWKPLIYVKNKSNGHLKYLIAQNSPQKDDIVKYTDAEGRQHIAVVQSYRQSQLRPGFFYPVAHYVSRKPEDGYVDWKKIKESIYNKN